MAALREKTEPLQINVGFVTLGKCKLEDIHIVMEGTRTSHYLVTVRVRQVREAETGTAELTVDAPGGSDAKSSAASGAGPTLVGDTSTESGSSGRGIDALGDLNNWLGDPAGRISDFMGGNDE